MNGKFRIIPFGFRRGDVIEYIKELSSEKGRLAEENQRLEQELESVQGRLDSLTGLLDSNIGKLEQLERSLEDARTCLAASQAELESSVSESDMLKKRLYSLHDSVAQGCIASDAELLEISETLSAISLKLKRCLDPVRKSINGAETPDDTEMSI